MITAVLTSAESKPSRVSKKGTQNMEIDEANTEIGFGATAEKWRNALSRAVKAVVELHVTATRNFDTERAGVCNATGFIVDRQRGIILTNRHVVQSGPVVAEATFLNREEIPVYPLYFDPVHDFGFFRFDSTCLKFMKCEEIPLAPEAAAVGLQIRVVGNDSGEKLSILAGTLARLDREAPGYNKYGYNDFNTFYMQAASGTKRGSSGSPVINCDGQAVGLNAGYKIKGSSAFFLPLDRVVRALKILQKGNSTVVHIPRGTLQMTLVHTGFDEARRLGFQGETEKFVREAFPAETGILVINSVVPGGPAHKVRLMPGDLLVRVNGELVTQFSRLETVLDDNVGKTIDLEFERGGDPVKVTLEVQDLHSITPDYFLEVSGGVIHPLSYQQARNLRFNCGLVYVAEPGYMLSRAGVPRHAIIKKLEGKEITGIEDFISILSKLSKGARVPLEFLSHKDRHRSKFALVTVNRHEWYSQPEIYTRDDVTGLWKKRPAMLSITSLLSSLSVFHDEKDTTVQDQPQVSSGGQLGGVEGDSSKFLENIQSLDGSALDELMNVSAAERIIEPTLVMVEVDIPLICMIDGVQAQHFSGTGVVIYHSKTIGIVAVDRNTVPIYLSDVMLAFAAYPMEIPGEVIFLHPVHNYALVAYDPAALGPSGAAAVRAASLLPEPALHKGDAVYLVGLNQRLQATSRKSLVRNPVAALNTGPFTHPRYRAMNMEVIELDTDFGKKFSGILADEVGRVQALWGSFSMQFNSSEGSPRDFKFVRGIPIYTVSEVLHKIINESEGSPLLINGIKMPMPFIRILEVELYSTLLSKARSFGLSEKRITELVKKDPVRQQVLQVKRCFSGSRAESMLKQGDMLLSIEGQPVTKFRDVENACQVLDLEEGNLRMTIFRQGLELDVLVGTDVRNGFGTTHMVNWCGSVLQEPHSAVRSLGFLPEEGHGVYVARRMSGSPIHRYGASARQWIVEVNGKPTPDLQTFVNVIKELEHGVFVRVKIVHLNGKPSVFTLKQDLHYWPTWELKFDPHTATWRQITIKALGGNF